MTPSRLDAYFLWLPASAKRIATDHAGLAAAAEARDMRAVAVGEDADAAVLLERPSDRAVRKTVEALGDHGTVLTLARHHRALDRKGATTTFLHAWPTCGAPLLIASRSAGPDAKRAAAEQAGARRMWAVRAAAPFGVAFLPDASPWGRLVVSHPSEVGPSRLGRVAAAVAADADRVAVWAGKPAKPRPRQIVFLEGNGRWVAKTDPDGSGRAALDHRGALAARKATAGTALAEAIPETRLVDDAVVLPRLPGKTIESIHYAPLGRLGRPAAFARDVLAVVRWLRAFHGAGDLGAIGPTHGDLKPSNVLVDGDELRILDWENFDERGHVSDDLFHFLLHSALLVHRDIETAVRQGFCVRSWLSKCFRNSLEAYASSTPEERLEAFGAYLERTERRRPGRGARRALEILDDGQGTPYAFAHS